MAVTTEDIIKLQKELALQKTKLEDDYALYASSCALVENVTPLGSGHDAWQEYENARESVDQAKKEYERLRHRYEQITDKKARVRESEAQVKKNGKTKEVMASRLGAAAWEAFQRGEMRESCASFFDTQAKQVTEAEAKIAKGGLVALAGKTKLALLKRNSYSLFVKCGTSLLEKERYKTVPDLSLVSETEALLQREKDLLGDLEEDRKSISNLEEQTDKGRLEKAESDVRGKEGKLRSLAVAYGKLVFEQVPPDTISHLVGQKAYGEGLSVLERLDKIASYEKKITQGKNQMEADELSAQNLLDLQKIVMLKEQRGTIDKQIGEIQATIQNRKRKIQGLGGKNDG